MLAAIQTRPLPAVCLGSLGMLGSTPCGPLRCQPQESPHDSRHLGAHRRAGHARRRGCGCRRRGQLEAPGPMAPVPNGTEASPCRPHGSAVAHGNRHAGARTAAWSPAHRCAHAPMPRGRGWQGSSRAHRSSKLLRGRLLVLVSAPAESHRDPAIAHGRQVVAGPQRTSLRRRVHPRCRHHRRHTCHHTSPAHNRRRSRHGRRIWSVRPSHLRQRLRRSPRIPKAAHRSLGRCSCHTPLSCQVCGRKRQNAAADPAAWSSGAHDASATYSAPARQHRRHESLYQ